MFRKILLSLVMTLLAQTAFAGDKDCLLESDTLADILTIKNFADCNLESREFIKRQLKDEYLESTIKKLKMVSHSTQWVGIDYNAMMGRAEADLTGVREAITRIENLK